MASKLEIWNMALVNITQSPSIQGVNEDSTEANYCRTYYDRARRSLLQGHDWNFARKRLTLAVIDDERNRPEWKYQYAYPTDCLQGRKILPVNSSTNAALLYSERVKVQYPLVPFEVAVLPSTGLSGSVDQKVVWTNKEDAVLEYTYNQENPAFFSEDFSMALSWQLAKFIAKPITNKTSVEDRAISQANHFTLVARASNMNERREPKQSEQPNAFTSAHF